MPLEHLPNAPLVEAVFELRFPGEPVVLASLDQYYARIRNQLSEVWVPNAQPGIAPALQPWEFKRSDGGRWVSASINTFAAHVLDYKDYSDFRAWALPLAQQFCDVFKIEKLTRVGALYRNEILLLRAPGKPIPLGQYLRVGFDLPELIDVSSIDDIHLHFSTRRSDAQLVVALDHIKESMGRPESLHLDLDCGVVDKVSSKDLSQHMDSVHSYIEDLFSSLAAEPYMAFMKGENL